MCAESRPLFALGRLVATPGALRLLAAAQLLPITLLGRHAAGDWVEMAPEDQALNRLAATSGGRILSSYTVGADRSKVWVITEWDRSVTTILLPSEY